MPAYEITWRIKASSDETALKVFKGVKDVHEAMQSVLPTQVSVSLKKVLDDDS